MNTLRHIVGALAGVAVMALATVSLWGQTSSLYLQEPDAAAANPYMSNGSYNAQAPGAGTGPGAALSPAVGAVSLSAVKLPEPHRFAVQDLVTIIVRESTSADSTSKLDASKESDFNGEVSDWPGVRIFDFFVDQLLAKGLQENPKLGLKYKNEFKGDGDYSRKDNFTTRVTARIIDVKPNGTMVLEARKFIQSDGESMELVLTGTCRREDVAADNTIQSTQIYDLRLNKNHKGELFRSNDKGVLTKLMEFFFNF